MTPNGFSSSASAVREILPPRAAIGFDPAAGAQKPGRARVLRELQVLGRRGEQERGHDLSGRRFSRLGRGQEVAPDGTARSTPASHDDMGARISVGRAARATSPDRPREQGSSAFSLNDAAVAEARLPRRLGQTVDERHGSAAGLKRERRRNAYDSAPSTMTSTDCEGMAR